MTKTEDDTLIHEITKLGAFGGIAGGIGGAVGGGLGAGQAAKRLSATAYEATADFSTSSGNALRTATAILGQLGRIVTDIETSSHLPMVCAVIGSGFLNLNPTLVSVEIDSSSDTLTQVRVRGVAKEGLIKQRSAQKAVKRILESLSQALLDS